MTGDPVTEWANRLPNPWSPYVQHHLASLSTSAPGAFASQTWPTANKALYIPVIFPCETFAYSLSFLGNNATGNYDIGFYDPNYNALYRKGSTPNAAAILTLTFGADVRVVPGRQYWAAIVFSSSSSGYWRAAGVGSVTGFYAIGFADQASAFPLPATMTPAMSDPSAPSLPVMTFGVR